MTRVRLYTTPYCPFCVAAKKLLDAEQVPYEDTDVSDGALRSEIQAKYDWPTVPVVLADEEVIGGFTELQALHAERGLDHLKG